MASRMIQNNFGGGEISPVLYGRSDLSSYYKSCAESENFVVTREGTLRKRFGVKTILSYDDNYGDVRLFPYKYDRTNGGVFIAYLSGSVINSVFLYKSSGVWKTSSVQINPDGGANAEDVKKLRCKQIGDELWFTSGNVMRIVRVNNFGEEGFRLTSSGWSQTGKPSPVSSIGSIGYNSSGSVITPSGRNIEYAAYVVRNGVMSDRRTVTQSWSRDWPSAYYINVYVDWQGTTDFDYILLTKKIGGNYGEVARWYPEDVSETRATFRDENISAGDAVYAQTNVLGSGFSRAMCVDCFQQRKLFANAFTDGKSYPMTMWFSEVGNLDNFFANRPASDSDAFSPTISSTGPSFIRWVCSFQEMMILFTESGLFSVGFSQTQGFSASTCRISRFSNVSVSPNVQPIVTDAGVVFVGGDEKTLYTASFDLQENSLKPINRSVMVEHLTRTDKIVSIGLQEYPDNVVWCSTKSGRLLSFTFERNEEVYAWSHSKLDGCNVCQVVSIGTVTDNDDERSISDIVMLVKRGGKINICTFDHAYKDKVGTGDDEVVSDVKALLTTIRPESQDRTISGLKKNIKDVMVRVYNTFGISLRNSNSDLPLVTAKMKCPFSGDVKVMPRGFVDDEGRITLVSDNDKACEIQQIVTMIEVAQ